MDHGTKDSYVEHMVVGLGQVGGALRDHLVATYGFDRVGARDLEPVETNLCRILHITFPYGEHFVDEVKNYEVELGASYVVVHSTVPVGTCDENGWVHSPVIGQHPNMRASLMTFTKHYGGEDSGEVASILKDAFPNYNAHPLAAVTEAGKLWLLARYALEILIEKTIFSYCDQLGLPFDQVYRDFTQTYNEGYYSIDADHQFQLLRHVPGPIGGHCVARGVGLLTGIHDYDHKHYNEQALREISRWLEQTVKEAYWSEGEGRV